MAANFKYLKEDTKFLIVSSIVGLGILILTIISGVGNGDHAGFSASYTGEIQYYSKILGISPEGEHQHGSLYSAGLFKADTWQMGGTAYAANIR